MTLSSCLIRVSEKRRGNEEELDVWGGDSSSERLNT